MKVAFLQPRDPRTTGPFPSIWDGDVTWREAACHTPAVPHPTAIILGRRAG
jgi:hypothetical protein